MTPKQLLDRWKGLNGCFRDVFGTSESRTRPQEVVLAELRKFCHWNRPTLKVSATTGMVDPLAMANAEGRREVFLRIVELCNLNDEKIAQLQSLQLAKGDE